MMKTETSASQTADVLATLKFEPLSFDRSAGTQIFESLKLAILRMDIPPGSLISEADVASLFGASRTPVREAFMQLREGGLVVTRPSRGNFVTRLSEDKIREARFVRSALELACVSRLCAKGLPEARADDIKNILDQQKDCLENGRDIEFQHYDDLFHFSLAASTGFPRMEELLEREKLSLDRLRVFSLKQQPRKETLYQEHVDIFEAILQRETQEAHRLMDAHLCGILETLSSMAAEHSEYFE